MDNEKIIGKFVVGKLQIAYKGIYKNLSKKEIDEYIDLYDNAFKNENMEHLEIALNSYFQKSKFWPTVAEIREELNINLYQDPKQYLNIRSDPDDVMVWNGKRCEAVPMSDEEQKEVDKEWDSFLDELGY